MGSEFECLRFQGLRSHIGLGVWVRVFTGLGV